MAGLTPPGWPAEVPSPEVDDREQEAVAWLLDQAPSHWRQDRSLCGQPVVLARRVVEQLHADVEAAGAAWLPLAQWQRAGLPAEAHEPVLALLAREGPALASRLRSAQMLKDALTSGRRWRPRL